MKNYIELSSKELLEICGGGSTVDKLMKGYEDAGQWVGGFLSGLFGGNCC